MDDHDDNAAHEDDERAAGLAPRLPDDPTDDEIEEWMDFWYGEPPTPSTSSAVIDPDTPEGAAIVDLYAGLRELEDQKDYWPGGDTVELLGLWFEKHGVDADAPVHEMVRKLRLAVRARPGRSLTARDYSIEIGTEHHAAGQVIAHYAGELAPLLGKGTVVVVRSAGEEIQRVEVPLHS